MEYEIDTHVGCINIIWEKKTEVSEKVGTRLIKVIEQVTESFAEADSMVWYSTSVDEWATKDHLLQDHEIVLGPT